MPTVADLVHRAGAGAIISLAAALAAAALALLAWRDRPRRSPLRVHAPASAPVADAPPDGTRAADVRALFGPIGVGDEFGTFRIATIHEPERGGIPVLFEGPDGARFRVDVLRRDERGPAPLAGTDRLALYLSGLRPGSATPEAAGLVIMTLAAALAEVGAEPPAWLLTMRGRPPVAEGPIPPPSGDEGSGGA